MPNIVNEMVERELRSEFDGVDGMVLVSFGGLTVAETETLRVRLAEKNVRFRMVRNSLARRVLGEKGYEFDEAALRGNTGIAYGDTEAAIDAAKIFAEKDVKKTGKVKFKAGVLDGEALDASAAARLADLPDRDTLRAQMLGVISGPARGLATVLNGLPSAVARVIQAHADEGAGE